MIIEVTIVYGMSSSAIVPSTETSTSAVGTTAMNASPGWRTVTQKKTASTVTATRTVVLTESVCRSRTASVTANEMIVSDVAVMAESSPRHSSSMSCWSLRDAEGSPV